MHNLPMIAVADVNKSADWYCSVIGCKRDHASIEFDRLRHGRRALLLLHDRSAQEHGTWADTDHEPPGDGFVLWLVTPDFDGTYARAKKLGGTIVVDPHMNVEDSLREFTMRDLDGYAVAVIEQGR